MVCDFSRSFVTFSVPGNNARIQLEARCVLTLPGQEPEQYLLFASCKSEDTYATRNLFRVPETDPNYDFSGLYSDDCYRIERVFADQALGGTETGLIANRFTGLRRHLRQVPALALPTRAAIITATLNHRVIIGRTVITDDTTGATQMLEYPVKTMNVHPETQQFQVDTGPVPLYDFAAPEAEVIARFRWSYVACNDFTKAWFVTQVPTPLQREGAVVAWTTHYSAVCDYPQAENSFFALEE